MAKQKKKESSLSYAFFDLDRTLLSQDTMFLFCNYILKKNRIRTLYLILFIPAACLHLCGLINYITLKRIFFSFLFAIPAKELDTYAKDFVQKILLTLFTPKLLEEIKKHKKAKHYCILNTASIHVYAQYIAQELGFDDCYATNIELPKIMPLIPKIHTNNKGAHKISAMQDVLPSKIIRHCLSSTLYAQPPQIQGAYTYTDSIADAPLIHLAEHIILVQPSEKKLLAWLEREKSPIQKNKTWSVIYHEQSYNKCQRIFMVLRQMIGLYSHGVVI